MPSYHPPHDEWWRWLTNKWHRTMMQTSHPYRWIAARSHDKSWPMTWRHIELQRGTFGMDSNDIKHCNNQRWEWDGICRHITRRTMNDDDDVPIGLHTLMKQKYMDDESGGCLHGITNGIAWGWITERGIYVKWHVFWMIRIVTRRVSNRRIWRTTVNNEDIADGWSPLTMTLDNTRFALPCTILYRTDPWRWNGRSL